MRDAERGEIVADHRHHRGDGALADQRQPLGLRPCRAAAAPNSAASAAPTRLQIVAGIEALRDRADRLAERLAVAQEGRAGEHVDLRAGVVDVIFARHLAAGEGQQVGERVAEHGAARVADMHRPGRIGADIFDVDRRPRRARRRARKPRPRRAPRAARRRTPAGFSRMLRKPGPATSTAATSPPWRRLAASASASARGFDPAALASLA